MIADRRPVSRPYAFEWILLAHVVLLAIVAQAGSLKFASLFPGMARAMVVPLAASLVGGVGLRAAYAAYRRRWRRYLAVITTPQWLVDTARLTFSEAVLTFVYGWIKLMVPVFNHRLYDQQLWDIDRTVFFGMSPNLFFLTLFSDSFFLRFIDWAYANIFVVTVVIAFAYFMSSPSRPLRIAFMTANVLLWIAGAYLYALVPSLGPAYRFPQVWFEYSGQLRITQRLQAILMRNYTDMLAVNRGANRSVSMLYGVAAFPSMHVAWQAFVFLWVRRQWIYGEVLFAIFLLLIFTGSMITGWHYLIDGVAGIALAAAAYYAVLPAFDLRRTFALRTSAERQRK